MSIKNNEKNLSEVNFIGVAWSPSRAKADAFLHTIQGYQGRVLHFKVFNHFYKNNKHNPAVILIERVQTQNPHDLKV